LQDVALAYLGRDAAERIPFWQMVATPVSALRARAEAITAAAGVGEAVDSEAIPGAGSAPGTVIPSVAIRLAGDQLTALRDARPAVVARTRDGVTLLDLRSVHPDDDEHLVSVLRACAS
jgi:L-seryl-tRNA(Ser) seleniumtransferase